MTIEPGPNDGVPTRRSMLFKRAETNNIPLKTILTTVVIIIGVYFADKILYRLRDILLLMLVGGFISLLLNPLVNILQRWNQTSRRGTAVFIVMLFAVLVFMGLAFAFGYPLVNSITHLAHNLPSYVHKAEHNKGWIGHLLHKYHIQHYLDANSAKLISFAKGLSKPALALGKGAATLVLALVTMFAFIVLLLLEAPKMRRFGLSMMAPTKSAWISRVGAEVSQVALGYMLGNAATSLIAGFVIFITLFCLSVPFAVLFGLWVAIVDFLPQIGGALAGIPTVLFAFIHSVPAGIITAVVFLIYTQVENHMLNPIIMSRTERINPLSVFVAILVGAEIGAWVGGIFGGFVGVLLAIPAAASASVVTREIWQLTKSPVGFVMETSSEEDPASPE
jgi:predicted PurR-regulated permease PerM